MSRLRSVTIPFVQGQDEGIDPKLLPDGALARLRNARFNKAGELALRTGWRPVDTSVTTDDGTLIGGDYTFQDLYSVGPSLVGLVRSISNTAPLSVAVFTEQSSTVPWTQRRGMPVSPATNIRVRGNVPDLPADVRRLSCVVTADGVWGAVVQQTSATSVLRVFRVATDETVFYDSFSASADSAPRKLVSFGTTFGLLENTGTVLRLRTIDPAELGVTSLTTLVTATITDFDAATAIKDTNTPVGVHVAYVEAGEVKYAQFTSAGAQTGTTKTVVASAATRCAIASDDTNVHVVYDNGSSELQLLTFGASGSFTTSAGPTAVNAGVAVTAGQFVVGCSSSIFVASGLSGSRTCVVNKISTAHSTNVRTDHDSSSLVGGFLFAENSAAVVVARANTALTLLNDVLLVDVDQPWACLAFSTGTGFSAAGVSAPYAPCQNLAGKALAAYMRLSDTSNTTRNQATTSGSTLTTRQAAVVSLDVYSTERRPGAVLGGVLHLAGGTVATVTNGIVVENGLAKPIFASITESNSSGTIANGTYEYRCVVTWTDAGGRIHRSPVSDAVENVISGSDDTVTALVHVAKTLRRDTELLGAPKVELYRTEAGPGELFYLVATAAVGATDDEVSVVDTLPDASIVDNRRLYTEGEFGAVSGALDVAPPSPSAYAVAVRDRLVLGGAGPELQYSQLVLPAEPVAFTQPGLSGPGALVYQDSVEGDLTALAALDDTIVAATTNQLYVVSASGGPNLAGVGEFPSPARLPSSVGIYDWRSVVESGDGLWFLGDVDKLYALPRGQGSPAFVGGPVEDAFAEGETVGAALDVTDHVLAWAVADGTDSVLVVRDLNYGQWGLDYLPFIPTSLVGHDGRMYAVDADGEVWERSAASYGDDTSGATAVSLVVETGDVAAFGGVAGWGRFAGVELLGEFQSAASITCEISYDSGTSWTSLGAHTVTGLSAGQAFQRQWYPAIQRGGKFRLRFTMTPSSTTAEGCRLAGFSLFYTQRSGPTRLDSAKRR